MGAGKGRSGLSHKLWKILRGWYRGAADGGMRFISESTNLLLPNALLY